MKFHSIKYENYRCFKNLLIDFRKTNKTKNIALIIAPNGGGKTEMLFSFWWVLYGFEFKKLKGKESTAYSLNSALYHELANSVNRMEKKCSVELMFEIDGTEYTLKRTETFIKEPNHPVTSMQSVCLSSVKPNGESSLPKEDSEEVERILNRIIPQKILSGILFDGERMKQLSSVDEDSKTAVEGVIKHITNEELFEMCKNEFDELKSEIDKELRKIGRATNNGNLNQITEQIAKYEKKKDESTEELEEGKNLQAQWSLELGDISNQLEQHRESQKYEQQRKQLKEDLADSKKSLDKNIENFYGDLWFGYTLISKPLVDAVRDIVHSEDLPGGLTADAVRSILLNKNCICGHCLGDSERGILEALISKLPPENINSTILEMARHAELDMADTKSKLMRTFGEIRDNETVIAEKKKEIESISSLITDGASAIIRDLEKRRQVIEKKRFESKQRGEKLQSDIENYTKLCDQLLAQRKIVTKNNEQSDLLDKKDTFIRKCLKALVAIDEFNKRESLKRINSKINDAYSILSEDYSRGKRLYVIQYDKADKYGMVSYLQSQYDELYERNRQDGVIDSYRSENKSDDEIKELTILKVRESNSTGQSKVNTLAFAKAILDYSGESREDDSTELTKSYPFLIDSPFTELAGGNLEMSAKNIHSFSEQLIMMISEDSLSDVKPYIEPYVACSYTLQKNEGESSSSLRSV